METKQTIYERETIRQFQAGIRDEQLWPLLEAGTWAPNHGKREPWRFIVFNQASAFAALQTAYAALDVQIPYFEKLMSTGNYPTMVVVVMPKNPEPKQYREDLLAHGSLIQNIQLAAWEQQIGVVWKTNFLRPAIGAAFGIRADEEVTGFLLLGTFAQEAQATARTRRPVAEIVTIIE